MLIGGRCFIFRSAYLRCLVASSSFQMLAYTAALGLKRARRSVRKTTGAKGIARTAVLAENLQESVLAVQVHDLAVGVARFSNCQLELGHQLARRARETGELLATGVVWRLADAERREPALCIRPVVLRVEEIAAETLVVLAMADAARDVIVSTVRDDACAVEHILAGAAHDEAIEGALQRKLVMVRVAVRRLEGRPRSHLQLGRSHTCVTTCVCHGTSTKRSDEDMKNNR